MKGREMEGKPAIPKIIHYCWFGGAPLPDSVERCMESWRRVLPDWEIRRTDEDDFDVNASRFTRDAYECGKFAFVSDVARFWRLLRDGGVYLDVDVEVLRPLDPFLDQEAFTGFESRFLVNPGLVFGALPGHPIVQEILDYYEDLDFILRGGTLNTVPVVIYTTDTLMRHGLKPADRIQRLDGITVYPKRYFCPLSFYSKKNDFGPDTHTIHHYASTWMTYEQRMAHKSIRYTFTGENVKWFLTAYGHWVGRRIANGGKNAKAQEPKEPKKPKKPRTPKVAKPRTPKVAKPRPPKVAKPRSPKPAKAGQRSATADPRSATADHAKPKKAAKKPKTGGRA